MFELGERTVLTELEVGAAVKDATLDAFRRIAGQAASATA